MADRKSLLGEPGGGLWRWYHVIWRIGEDRYSAFSQLADSYASTGVRAFPVEIELRSHNLT